MDKLREIIVNQYDKVNKYMHKRFGYDKYDLAQMCDTTGSILATASGTAMVFREQISTSMAQGEYFPLVFSGAMIGFGVYKQFTSLERNKNLRKAELETLVRTGARCVRDKSVGEDIAHSIYVWSALWVGGSAIAQLVGGLPSDFMENFYPGQVETGILLQKFSSCTYALAGAALASANYFRDCTMFPPSGEKKGILNKVWNYISSPFRPTPTMVPQEIPK